MERAGWASDETERASEPAGWASEPVGTPGEGGRGHLSQSPNGSPRRETMSRPKEKPPRGDRQRDEPHHAEKKANLASETLKELLRREESWTNEAVLFLKGG